MRAALLAGLFVLGCAAPRAEPPPAETPANAPSPTPPTPSGPLAAEPAPAPPTAAVEAPAARLAPRKLPPPTIASDPESRARAARRVHVQPLDPSGERLWVDFAAATELDDVGLAGVLEPLAPSVVDLGLARTHAGPVTLELAGRMPRLERLDLRGTAVGTDELARLGPHAGLKRLLLAETRVDDRAVELFARWPALERLHVWRAKLTPDGIARLRAARPDLAVESGTEAPAKPLETEPEPRLVSGRSAAPAAPAAAGAAPAAALTPVNARCPVTDGAVNPAFAVVFEGRVVGFCCENCPTKFWKDPEAYRAKLPR